MAETYSIRWFEETDSTNTQLAAVRTEVPSGTVYAARWQSAGRGQRGNRWESRRGENLTFSILYKPVFLPAAAQFALAQAAATGVVDYLSGEGVSARVKWPNDIYVGDEKICGMLIEHSLRSDKLAESIVGIGLNVNQETFPEELSNATSLRRLTRRERDLREELPRLLAAVDRRYESLRTAEGRQALNEAYLEKLYRKGEWHVYLDRREADPLRPTTEAVPGTRFEGCIRGLSPTGELRIERRDGTLLDFAFKEVSYIL